MKTERDLPAPQLLSARSGSLAIHSVVLDVTMDDSQLQELRLIFLLTPADWERVDREQLFHLSPEVRGPVFGGELEEGVEVEVEARLSTAGLALVGVLAESPADVERIFLQAGATHELRQTESWYALYVKQPLGTGLKIGFATTYSD